MAKGNILLLLGKDFFAELERDLVTSTVLALRQNKKIVTARTARSVRAETIVEGPAVISVNSIGSGGLPFIISGKRPNTKLPVRKIGNSFELVPELKDWAKTVGFSGPDFVLAREIAKNARRPVDIGKFTQENFLKIARRKIGKKISSLALKDFSKDLKKDVKI